MTRAVLRNTQGSPTKVRLVLNMIRGLDVTEARELLRFSQRGAAVEVAKLLDSAVANAEHNDHIPSDELYISATWADEGATAKRFRPRARGRGTRIRKRTSHITIVVERYSDEELRQRSVREESSGTGAATERRRRLSRGRRVAASTAAEAHDHDHDHDHEGDEIVDEAPEAVADDVADATDATADDETTAEAIADADATADAENDEDSDVADADAGEDATDEPGGSSKGEQ
jgi:large subunit ribosomal protein L22